MLLDDSCRKKCVLRKLQNKPKADAMGNVHKDSEEEEEAEADIDKSARKGGDKNRGNGKGNKKTQFGKDTKEGKKQN